MRDRRLDGQWLGFSAFEQGREPEPHVETIMAAETENLLEIIAVGHRHEWSQNGYKYKVCVICAEYMIEELRRTKSEKRRV